MAKVEGKNEFSIRNPKSIEGLATKEQKAMIRKGRKEAREEWQAYERWVSNGCMSGSPDVSMHIEEEIIVDA